MEYTPYYTAAQPQQQQPYHFLGMPTPARTGSDNSEHFSNQSPDRDFLHDASYAQPLMSPKPDVYDYQNYETFNQHFNASPLPPVKPTAPISTQHKPSVTAPVSQNYDISNGVDLNDNANQRGSNSDDDDNMTPAQTRRKAQNRAAQRAFRERKERHVKDLEAKLANMEKSSATVAEENERLRLQLQKAATENEILKATSAVPRSGSEGPLPDAGPMRYSPTDFYTEVLYAHENKTPSHRIVTSDNGDRLLAAGATWDYIIKHPLYVRGMVDVGNVSDRLKVVAKCDGQGPVFEEREIIKAIESSVASGNDELL